MLPDVESVEASLKAAIHDARAARGISQTALAAACGVDQPRVSLWESPTSGKMPKFEQLARAEDFLKVPRGYFLARVGLVSVSGVQAAVAADADLDEEARQELLAAYETVRRQARRRARRPR